MEPTKERASPQTPTPTPRQRPQRYCQPLLIELAGCMNDALLNELAARLRKYRNRYAPIVRLMVTLIANNMEEATIFGLDGVDNEAQTEAQTEAHQCADLEKRKRSRADAERGMTTDATQTHAHAAATMSLTFTGPLLARPLWAVTANKSIPVVRRLHSTSPSAPPSATTATTMTNPGAGTNACASVTSSAAVRAAHEASVLAEFEQFMSFDFLPLAITHNRLRAYAAFYKTQACAADTHTQRATTAAPFSQADVARLVLKPYVHDAARTTSFLVADRASGRAALIDPRVDAMAAYEADLAALKLSLTHVIVTHAFLDCALAIEPLCRRHPSAKVTSGLPLQPAGTMQTVTLESSALPASGEPLTRRENGTAAITLHTVAIPSFSPENILVELRLGGALVAIFCGTAWGTDAGPRSDYFAAFTPLLQAIQDEEGDGSTREKSAQGTVTSRAVDGDAGRDAALPFWIPDSFYDQDSMRIAQAALKTHWYDAYLYPPPPAAAASTCSEVEVAAADLEYHLRKDTVVVFPSHGGYNNVTNQLDLYWAMHLHDFRQQQHAKRVIDTLTSSDVYVKFNRRMPPLPRAMLYQSNRGFNVRQILRTNKAAAERAAGMRPSPTAITATPAAPPLNPLSPVMLDLRNENAYHAHHIEGSINVPMSFPTSAFGAKRAELWLQCVIVPGQPILALCEDPAQREVVRARLYSVAPQASVIAVATLTELLGESARLRSATCGTTITSPSARPIPALPPSCSASQQTLTIQSCMLRPVASIDAGVAAVDTVDDATEQARALFPEMVWWVHYSTPLERLSTFESLNAIEPRADTLVVDVRTPYEFKNGSHQHSVHYQLCDLCTDTAADTLRQSRGTRMSNASSPDHNSHHTGDSARVSNASASADGRPSRPIPSFSASPALGGMWVRRLHTDGLVAGLSVERDIERLHQICFYCAGGYRSLIAESLLERAVVAAAPESVFESTEDGPLTLTSTASSLCWLHTLKLVDVPGGAFQIMTQRPDLWRVKDRSIICIS